MVDQKTFDIWFDILTFGSFEWMNGVLSFLYR